MNAATGLAACLQEVPRSPYCEHGESKKLLPIVKRKDFPYWKMFPLSLGWDASQDRVGLEGH